VKPRLCSDLGESFGESAHQFRHVAGEQLSCSHADALAPEAHVQQAGVGVRRDADTAALTTEIPGPLPVAGKRYHRHGHRLEIGRPGVTTDGYRIPCARTARSTRHCAIRRVGPCRPTPAAVAKATRGSRTRRGPAVTVRCVESTGLGDDVENWLASGTDVRRLAAPASTFIVPGLGPMLIIAIIGWPDSLTVLTVEPGLGVQAKHSNVRLALRDDLGGFHRFRQGGGGGGGPFGRMIYNSTFDGAVPEGARALHLYGLPGRSVFTHTGADPMPAHVTIELD
jgi:hypothetical protein